MDLNAYRPKSPPKTDGGSKTIKASARCVSFLWDTTVPNNPFGTDGPVSNAPDAWPGDNLPKCRQWHGLDVSVKFQPDGSVRREDILVSSPAYSGTTETCGFVGKTTTTDRHVTEPVIRADQKGRTEVVVKSLLGTRLGAFIPDIDVGEPLKISHWDLLLAPLLPEAVIAKFIGQHLFEETVEQISEEGYLGHNFMSPKIFNYFQLVVREAGPFVRFVSNVGGHGFHSQADIIEKQIGFSWIPEHHLYLNGWRTRSQKPVAGSDADLEKWIDSPFQVGERFAFDALSNAIKEWDKTATNAQRQAIAARLKKEYPDYYIGLKLK